MNLKAKDHLNYQMHLVVQEVLELKLILKKVLHLQKMLKVENQWRLMMQRLQNERNKTEVKQQI